MAPSSTASSTSTTKSNFKRAMLSSSEGVAESCTPNEVSPLLQDAPRYLGGNEVTPPQTRHDSGEDSGLLPTRVRESTSRLAPIVACVWGGTFLAALDGTVVATLAAPISSSFDSFTLLPWLGATYFIGNAATQPLCGQLTDIFGRRAGLVVSGLIFALGNLCCGLATEPWVLIVGRVLAGVGGGAMNAIGTFVCNDIFPLRQRGLWQGLGNIFYGLGHGSGGVFGGYLNDTWGWRSAFLIIAPLALWFSIVTFLCIGPPVTRLTNNSRIHRIDFLGSFTMAVTMVLLLLGLNSGGSTVPWTHPLVTVSIPLSALFLMIFIYIETYIAKNPVIPLRLMLKRTVAGACLANWFNSMAMLALLFYMPIYFQLQGWSTTGAGARLFPQSLGNAIGSLAAGIVMYMVGRYRHLVLGFLTLFTAAMGAICTLHLISAAWLPLLYLLLAGIGFGGMVTTTLVALIGAVPPESQAVVTSANYAFRSTGSTIGITVASTVFEAVLTKQLWRHFGDRDDATGLIHSIKNNIDELKHLSPTIKQPALESYIKAFRYTSLSFLVFSILSLLSGYFILEGNLTTTLMQKSQEGQNEQV